VYGTIARFKIKRENLDALRALLAETQARNVPGFRSSHLLIPDEWNDQVWVVAVFEDEATYRANADSPEQHEEYLRYRALLEAEPEWTDGEIVSSP
jgi:heme-degrading monooxygenase HmoA